MRFSQHLLAKILPYKHHQNTPVYFALFTEFLVLATASFLVLLTLEIMLPTFISAHINLAVFFGILLILFALHDQLSHWLSLSLHSPHRYILFPLFLFFALWSLAVLILSLSKFPVLCIILTILIVIALGYIVRKATV